MFFGDDMFWRKGDNGTVKVGISDAYVKQISPVNHFAKFNAWLLTWLMLTVIVVTTFCGAEPRQAQLKWLSVVFNPVCLALRFVLRT